MKIFISWSGELSQKVATIIHYYLPLMIQGINVYMSKHDLESGSRWSNELSKELEESSFGILCLTNANLTSPWILFEAGALTKHINGRACGLLIGTLKATDVVGPLSQFQNREFEKKNIESLILDINKICESPLEQNQIKKIFNQWWPDIDNNYKDSLKTQSSENIRTPRVDRDLLEEILFKVRNIENEVSSTDSYGSSSYKTRIDHALLELWDADQGYLYDFIIAQNNNEVFWGENYDEKTFEKLCKLGLLEKDAIGRPKMQLKTLNLLKDNTKLMDSISSYSRNKN